MVSQLDKGQTTGPELIPYKIKEVEKVVTVSGESTKGSQGKNSLVLDRALEDEF